MSLNDRVLQFIKNKGLTAQKFENMSNLSNGAVAKMGENTRRTTLDKISKAFPELNINWLLTGEGSMLIESNAHPVGEAYPVTSSSDDTLLVEFVPISAHATFAESFATDADRTLERVPIVPRANERTDADALAVFEVDGDSMAPTIISKALILTKQIPAQRWQYAEGVCVVVFAECVVVKRIVRNTLSSLLPGTSSLVLGSDNPAYGEMTVPLSELRAIYKVTRIISSEVR